MLLSINASIQQVFAQLDDEFFAMVAGNARAEKQQEEKTPTIFTTSRLNALTYKRVYSHT